jgi:hypothetical protein
VSHGPFRIKDLFFRTDGGACGQQPGEHALVDGPGGQERAAGPVAAAYRGRLFACGIRILPKAALWLF